MDGAAEFLFSFAPKLVNFAFESPLNFQAFFVFLINDQKTAKKPSFSTKIPQNLTKINKVTRLKIGAVLF